MSDRPARRPDDFFDSGYQTPTERIKASLWRKLDEKLPLSYRIPDPDMVNILMMDGVEHTEAVKVTRGKSVETLFTAEGSPPEPLIDRTVWKAVCEKLPGHYTIPDPALAKILQEYQAVRTPQLCIVVLAHENEDVLLDQVENLRKFNPGAKIVLYNGGTNPDLGKRVNADICPYSKPAKYDKMGVVLLDAMVWLEETNAEYDYLLYLDSDALFVDSGFATWLDAMMSGYDMMGINMCRYGSAAECQHWIPGRMMWEDWERWQPVLQTDSIVGTLNGMQVYRRDIVHKMIEACDLAQIRQAFAETNVFASEEIVYATLAARCGGRFQKYPHETVQYVRLGEPYEKKSVYNARRAPNVFFIHPITRTWGDPAREVIRGYPAFKATDKMKLEDRARMLDSKTFMERINRALNKKQPLSVVNVGATESYVMAQDTVLPEEEFMAHPEAEVANLGRKNGFYHRGIRFPNRAARDEAVNALRKADLVGYNTMVRTWDGGLMAERVFEVNGIKPKYLFDGYLRRVIMFTQKALFEKMLAGRKILLIGSPAPATREALNRKMKDRLGFEIVGAIPIYEYEELPDVKRQIAGYEFDLCLLSAGVNALILAPYIAETYGKVAFDIGFGMQSLITGTVYKDEWLTELIGLDRLMRL